MNLLCERVRGPVSVTQGDANGLVYYQESWGGFVKSERGLGDSNQTEPCIGLYVVIFCNSFNS